METHTTTEIAVVSSLPFTEQELSFVLASRLADSSIAMYTRDVRAYRIYAQTHGLDPLDHLTLIQWRDDLVSNTTMSPNTINRMLSAVKRLMKEAAKRDRIPETLELRFSRVEGVTQKALKKRLKPHARTRIEPEEMRRLCELPDTRTLVGVRDAALLATLASSGIRVEEIATLTWDKIKKQGKGYVLLVRGKTDVEERKAHLSKEAYELLLTWKIKQPVIAPWVFTSFSGNRQIPSANALSKTAVWKIVTHYAAKCNLAHIKPHDFRRFVGTQLAATDIRKAQKALGHKSIETTAKHYVLDEIEPGLTDHLY